MKCRGPITVKPSELHPPYTIPCGQCLHCRIDRRDQFVARALLENLSNPFGQMLTLTFDDAGLDAFYEHGPRYLFRNFRNAVAQRERRMGNPLQFRAVGVTELGGTTGRPHIHALCWNHLNTSYDGTPYKKDLPRPRFQIPQWPHGHVDFLPMSAKSCGYVAKYVTDFNRKRETDKLDVFHVCRPALGREGLALYIAELAKSPTRGWVHNPGFVHQEKTYALDQTMRKEFYRLCRYHGLQVEFPPGLGNYLDNRWRREAKIEETETVDKIMRAELGYEQKQRLFEAAEICHRTKEMARYERAFSISQYRQLKENSYDTQPVL